MNTLDTLHYLVNITNSLLHLQAHFIDELPDIEPLLHTLKYANLSFNDFRVSDVTLRHVMSC